MIVITCLLLGSSVTNLRQKVKDPPPPTGYHPTSLFRERHNPPKKNPAYINILNNLEKQKNIVIYRFLLKQPQLNP